MISPHKGVWRKESERECEGTVSTKQAEKISKAELVYQSVRQEITDGNVAPGERLVIGDFAKRFSCSALPVREAFRRLEADGLITYETNVGARVIEVDLSAYVDAMQTVSLLEAAATALSAPHLTLDDLEEARIHHLRMASMLDSFDALKFTNTNEEFHRVLYRRCPNASLLQSLEQNWDRLRSSRQSSFTSAPNRAHGSVKEHSCILALIEAGMPSQMIENSVRLHRMRTLNKTLISAGRAPLTDE